MGCDIKHGHCSVRSHLEGLIQCKLAASYGGLFDAELCRILSAHVYDTEKLYKRDGRQVNSCMTPQLSCFIFVNLSWVTARASELTLASGLMFLAPKNNCYISFE